MKKVKVEYKKTDLGVIPKDWEIDYLGKAFNIYAGGDYKSSLSSEYKSDICPYPIYSNSLKNSGLYGYCNYAAYKKDSLTITARGTIGVANYRADPFTAIGRVLVLEKKKKINCLFVAEYINNRIEFIKEVTGVPQLTAPKISKYQFVSPSYQEQKVIAEVLSSVDVLIKGLKQLISKKRNMKIATKQLLLTGKKRLPGFDGKWVKKYMAQDSYLKARIGWQGLTTAEYLKTGNHLLITGTDFQNGKISWDSCHYVEKSRYDQDTNIQVKIGDILLTKDGTIGKVAFVDSLPEPATLNSGVFVIRPINNSYYPLYFYYVLSSEIFGDFLNKLQAGSTINHLYQKDFIHFLFKTPPFAEQQAIASVLSDMDGEIKVLEQRLKKTRELKFGMIQELLTGNIRLLKSEEFKEVAV